jgi:ABC-type Fe3+/spermidine/putrescine transport system ATPase subunit
MVSALSEAILMIIAQDLSKHFSEVRAVDQVSFKMPAGESLAIYGPSGSGKTTLLRLIAGLEKPDEGTVQIQGKLVSGQGVLVAPSERGVGFVFQSPALWPHMNVTKNILFGLKELPKQEAQERLGDLLERTKLQGLESRYPSQLSGGQARRVALARTLAPKPKILLMDEPLTNVDPDLKVNLLTLVKEVVSQESITMIYVTHDMEEAAQIAGEHLLEMTRGRLMEPTGSMGVQG